MTEDLHPDLKNSPTIPLLRRMSQYGDRAMYFCSTMNRGQSFVRIPQRDIRVRRGELVTKTMRKKHSERIVGHCLESDYPENSQVPNTLARELVIIILGRKDIMFDDQSRAILFLRDMILRVAGSQPLRQILSRFENNHATFIQKIIQYGDGDGFSGVEIEAQEHYEFLMDAMKIREYEKVIIKTLSWEWKVDYASYPYSCRMWILIMCFIKLIDLKK